MTTLLAWRKSSYSGGGNGGCVETAAAAAGMAVRDSKDPDGPVLGTFGFADWNGFVGAVKDGSFRA